MVVPRCPTTRKSLTIIDAMVKANTKPAAVTTRAGGAHAPDDSGVQAGVDFFFEPGDHEQVVVRPHRQPCR